MGGLLGTVRPNQLMLEGTDAVNVEPIWISYRGLEPLSYESISYPKSGMLITRYSDRLHLLLHL